MSIRENMRIIDEFIDALNKRDWDRVGNLHSESVVYLTPDNVAPEQGREKVKQIFVGYTGVFPDAHNRKEHAFTMGDWVCAEYTFIGTHRVPMTGPTGNQVAGKIARVPWVSLYRIADGRIVEWHAYWDALGMWKQLGY